MKHMKLFVFCLILYTTVKYSSARCVRKTRILSTKTVTRVVGDNENLSEADLIKQAKYADMDEASITKLLSTKEPVTITNTDALGHQVMATYKLTDGGGISERIVTEELGPWVDVDKSDGPQTTPQVDDHPEKLLDDMLKAMVTTTPRTVNINNHVTVTVNGSPAHAALYSKLKDVLSCHRLTNEDLSNLMGKTFTKTLQAPDGRSRRITVKFLPQDSTFKNLE